MLGITTYKARLSLVQLQQKTGISRTRLRNLTILLFLLKANTTAQTGM